MTPLRLAAFRQLWYSTLAAGGAQGMERTATAWLALETGGGAFAIGLTFAARLLPALLLGLAAGTLADRSHRPRQLLVVATAALLLTASFAWLNGLGNLRIWQVILFSFAAGCVQVLDTPVRQALVMDVVPREVAPRALALNALGARVVFALGAFAAGVLIPSVGVARCYLLVAVAYGLVAILVGALNVGHKQHVLVKPPPFRQAFGDALRLMVTVPVVQTLVVAGVVCEVFAFSHQSGLPLLAQDALAAGAKGLGTLNAAASVGGALSVLFLTLLPGRVRLQPLLSTVFLVYGLAILTLATTRVLAAATVVMLVIGMCAAAFDVLRQTLIQMAVPDEQRGRAVGMWTLSIGSSPLGHLEMGLLGGALGVPSALLINGTLTVVAAIMLLACQADYRWRMWGRANSP